MLRVAAAIVVLAGVAFFAAVWWPNAQDGPRPPARPPVEPATGTARPDAGATAKGPESREPAIPEPGPSLSEAKAWADLDRPAETIERCDAILEKDPGNPEALFLRGKAQLQIGMHRLAEQDLRASVEKEPNPERLEALAESIKLRQPGEAVEFLRRSTELDGTRARPHAMMARVLWRIGKRDDARAALDRALSIDPGDPFVLSLRDVVR